MHASWLSRRLLVLLAITALAIASPACSGGATTDEGDGSGANADAAGEGGGSADGASGGGDAGTTGPEVGEGSDDVGCVPSCDDKECGDDGCGGICGICPALYPTCVEFQCKAGCVPPPCQTNGWQCGDDGCGNICGACGGSTVCQNNMCVDLAGCTPNCFGKQCGDDGCGGSCGACSGTLWCQNGVCVGNGCTPNCQGIQCGPDGCGGSCGTCFGDSWCQNGVCTSGGCTPDCTNKECGKDGCGGDCGACPAGTACNASGICQSSGGTGQGECTNATDQAILNSIDAQTMATECGLGCIGDINPSACATTCLQAQSNLSAGCSGCFGKLVGCIIDHCLTDCIAPDSPECTQCTASMCGPAFETCSGLTLN
ncbi:MAG: hypothetical protein QF464_02935 [Myxococcota bacterium]|nr:hypothetical protein [Myxococcota bacterium]